ncbi:MAG TPA: hypothetical protein PLE45_02110 [Spirochaetota bacterium]|nr:hypothetical protein [Spirochaetota bacterium]HOL57015.1 hypothetical protein [Spirochaetota bacterium]HPP04594.1 hypothetical protein [Spirochaetota bacterium]
MPDIEKIKKDYEKLKSISYSKLIPLNKVIELETEKEIIINKFLSKITRITDDFEIVSTENFTLDDIIELTKKKFGDLNFFDKNKEENQINIDMAFNFCIISISYYKEKIKYRMTVFWDV